MKKITLQFVPYSEIAYLSSYRRVKKLIEMVSEDKILLVQGKLQANEEADLIEETMRCIGKSRKFKGIELATFTPQSKELTFFQNMRERLANSILGKRDVFTIIGPATIVREIKKDPSKIQLLLRK